MVKAARCGPALLELRSRGEALATWCWEEHCRWEPRGLPREVLPEHREEGKRSKTLSGQGKGTREVHGAGSTGPWGGRLVRRAGRGVLRDEAGLPPPGRPVRTPLLSVVQEGVMMAQTGVVGDLAGKTVGPCEERCSNGPPLLPLIGAKPPRCVAPMRGSLAPQLHDVSFPPLHQKGHGGRTHRWRHHLWLCWPSMKRVTPNLLNFTKTYRTEKINSPSLSEKLRRSWGKKITGISNMLAGHYLLAEPFVGHTTPNMSLHLSVAPFPYL